MLFACLRYLFTNKTFRKLGRYKQKSLSLDIYITEGSFWLKALVSLEIRCLWCSVLAFPCQTASFCNYNSINMAKIQSCLTQGCHLGGRRINFGIFVAE